MTPQRWLLIGLLLLTGVGWASVGASGSDDTLVAVQRKNVTLENFRLESGRVLPVMLAYETYGKLTSNGRRAQST